MKKTSKLAYLGVENFLICFKVNAKILKILAYIRKALFKEIPYLLPQLRKYL